MSVYQDFTEHYKAAARRIASAKPSVPPPPAPPKPPINYGIPSMSDEAKRFVRNVLVREKMVWGDLVARDRRLFKVHIRSEIYVFLNDRGWSLTQIGNLFERHHTSVLHGIRKWRKING